MTMRFKPSTNTVFPLIKSTVRHYSSLHTCNCHEQSVLLFLKNLDSVSKPQVG